MTVLVLKGHGNFDANELRTWTQHERLGNRDLTQYTRDGSNSVIPDANSLFYMGGLHGQCGVVCLYNFSFNPGGTMRNALTIGEKFAKWLGYTKMQITLTAADRLKAAKEYGFETQYEFENRRTYNRVYALIKDVVYE